jgi:hypothetical protein
MTGVTFVLLITICMDPGGAAGCNTVAVYQKNRDLCEASARRIAAEFHVRKRLCLPLIGSTVP